MPKAYKQLREITTRLERHYRTSRTSSSRSRTSKLYMLQTRNGKRTGYAAVVIATDLVEREADHAEGRGADGRAGGADQLLAPIFDPKEWKAHAGRDQGAAGVARRGLRPDRVHRRRCRRVDAAGQEGDARAQGDGPGRHPRHVRRAGHPHGDRRHDVARRRRRSPDGEAVGRRRRRAGVERARQDASASARRC